MRIARMAMFVIGPIFLLVAAIPALGTRSFLQHAIRARATITALELRTDPEDQTDSYYYPRFVFTTRAAGLSVSAPTLEPTLPLSNSVSRSMSCTTPQIPAMHASTLQSSSGWYPWS